MPNSDDIRLVWFAYYGAILITSIVYLAWLPSPLVIFPLLLITYFYGLWMSRWSAKRGYYEMFWMHVHLVRLSTDLELIKKLYGYAALYYVLSLALYIISMKFFGYPSIFAVLFFYVPYYIAFYSTILYHKGPVTPHEY